MILLFQKKKILRLASCVWDVQHILCCVFVVFVLVMCLVYPMLSVEIKKNIIFDRMSK